MRRQDQAQHRVNNVRVRARMLDMTKYVVFHWKAGPKSDGGVPEIEAIEPMVRMHL